MEEPEAVMVEAAVLEVAEDMAEVADLEEEVV